MSMVCKCDRCGATIKHTREDGMALRVYDSANIVSGAAVKVSADLCNSCLLDLESFLNEFQTGEETAE